MPGQPTSQSPPDTSARRFALDLILQKLTVFSFPIRGTSKVIVQMTSTSRVAQRSAHPIIELQLVLKISTKRMKRFPLALLVVDRFCIAPCLD